MTDLVPMTALGAQAPRDVDYGVLTITENSGQALASLAVRRGAASPDLGFALPGPGCWVAGENLAAFWIAPDQWMLEAPGRAEEAFPDELKQLAPGCSVTEQTDGWIIFEIESKAGANPLLKLMEKLVDIDTTAFGSGSATRTGLHHMSVFAVRRSESQLAIIGMRSAAGSLWHALETAAARLEASGGER